MKKGSGSRASLSQGVLSATSKDAGKNLSILGHGADPAVSVSRSVCITPPRATTPSKSVAVDLPQALTDLSLSDGELVLKVDDNKRCTPRKDSSGTEVLVTEINQDAGVASHGEVETRSFTTQSPAKVICHSPSSYEGVVPDPLIDIKEVPTVSLDGGSAIGEALKQEGDSNKKKLKGTGKKKRYLPVQSKYRQSTSKDNSLEFSVIPSRSNAKPAEVTQKLKSRPHSTPYLMNSTYYEKQVAPVDGSILDTTAFQLRAAEAEKAVKKKATKSKKNVNSGTKDHSGDYGKKPKDKEIDGLNQLSLDLHYARNMQLTYLLMNAKEVFEKEEENAKADIYGVWAANRKLEKEIKTLEQSIEMKQLEICIDQLLKVAVDGLSAINDKFSKVVISTSKLSDALENTAHYLPVRNVVIDENKLLASLGESKRILAELNTPIRVNQPDIEELANSAAALKKTLLSELDEQRICGELMASCKSLVNNERSLQVQLIQEGD